MTKTERFFHCLGMTASLSALLAAENIECSTVVTAMGGNGVEFGIQISALGNEWFTAPAPVIEGRYISSKYTEKDVLPWMGDSCVVETAGLGGFVASASPIVVQLRGGNVRDALNQTNEMRDICLGENTNYPIPSIDFAFPPIGIDIRKVLETGIAPICHGGGFSTKGGLVGAGVARAPIDCFEKALLAFAEEYHVNDLSGTDN